MYTYISVLACGACTGVYYQVKMEYVKRLVWLHNPDPGKYWCFSLVATRLLVLNTVPVLGIVY